ncbi:MAG TPA: hypothetical protein VN253_00980 [Kofleriaceae bacterium]|nr:hypothetical protein [Kofleriaceae bacterium]
MYTTKAFRLALTAAALCAAGTTTADAKPRRVVILDFDGPRTLADSGRTAVINLLGEQYDVVATKRWEQARAAVKDVRGPQGWRKASKQSGVDAVIEGWIQDEGRSKLLYVLVRDASTGDEVDKVSVKLGKSGVSTTGTDQLRTSLDEVLEYVETNPEIGSKLPAVTPKQAVEMVGAKRRLEGDVPAASPLEADQRDRPRRVKDGEKEQPAEDAAPRGKVAAKDGEGDGGVTERKPEKPSREVAAAEQEKSDAIRIFGPEAVETDTILGKQATHVPQPTPRFAITAGGWYGARSFVPQADSNNVQDYSARSKGFQLSASVYPFPTKKMDGIQSGIGFSFNLYHSAGSQVGADTDDTVGNYQINQHGFEGAIHYRQPLGLVSIDGEVGYGQHNYILASDFPLEVPDTQYSAFHAGAHLDLHVTERATIGFGGKLFYVLDNGDMSSLDWYGPGSASGFDLDASFEIPLPAQLFVRGELSYRRITTDFDGAGAITEEETVLSATDATMNGSVNLGIHF